MSYIDMIKERARLDKKTIVLPESNDKRTLLAAARIVEEGIADIIMIGDVVEHDHERRALPRRGDHVREPAGS